MSGKTNLKSLVVISVLLAGILCATASGGVVYVDANAAPGGDGTSWAAAYKYLQDALYKPPTSGDQIWVAAGTYKPDADEGGNVTPDDRTETFQLINGVAIYGGFPSSSDPNWNDREPSAHETILSGDINVPDVNSDNSYHVVTGSGTDANAVLDGFTITAGYADGLGPHTDNDQSGGGMFSNVGGVTLTNCTFRGNYAISCGGGMLNRSNSNPTLTKCNFVGNSAGSDGGAMYNAGSGPCLINCSFIENSVVDTLGGGGGIYCAVSSPMLSGCKFRDNSAASGGGMYNFLSSNPTLTNCTFQGNSANYQGGGMRNDTNSSPILTDCTFSGNYSVNSAGGGMYNNDSSPTVTGCTFSGNWADSGGGVYNGYQSNPNLANCILWGNAAPNGAQIHNEGGTPSVTYCDVEGDYPGTGNIDEDPLFVDADGPDNIVGTEDDNLRLSLGSPCLDAGDNTAVPSDAADLDEDGNTVERTPLDLDGKERFVDDPPTEDTGVADPPDYPKVVDMGAYEFDYVYGDLDTDGHVDANDLNALVGWWANRCIIGDWCGGCDINHDLRVNFGDFAILAENWLWEQ